MIKIVIDKATPFVRGVFEPYAEVVYADSDKFDRGLIADADALILRTRTKCGEELLDGSSVKIIATTTTGTENIDYDYCLSKGIYVRSAKGYNAGGVMNYVYSALYGVASRKAIKLTDATIGVVGVGSVGSRIERTAQALGLKILRYDPLRAEAEGPGQFCSLDELLSGSGIVTMHFPLNESTRRMANDEFFAKMRPGAIFINTSKGELVDDEALKRAIPKLGAVIIDAWNNEPDVDLSLLNMVDIATPHISSYSYQGKQNGSASAVRSVARFFDIPELFDFFPATDLVELEAVKLDVHGKTQGQIASLFQYNYPIFTDDFMFRLHSSEFAALRAGYSYRREFYID